MAKLFLLGKNYILKMCCQLSANIIGAWGKLECQVKPARGGSSMGVSVANGMESAVRKAQALITEVMFDNANQNASNMMLSDSSCAWMGCSLIDLYLLICVVLCAGSGYTGCD